MPEITNIEKSTEETNVCKDVVYDASMLGSLLPVYYKRLFPHKLFHRWLSYGLSEPNIFQNREISFTMEGDVYLRFQCFEVQAELEKWICQNAPYKIDLGPVMAMPPRNFLSSPLSKVPVQRELVFDIDMTDYDDVRTCCSGAAVCQRCWKFMTVAVRILDAALREDFNFEHLLWVFSGRRGVHCWACDYEARYLDVPGRSAVADYLQLITYTNLSGGNKVARVMLNDRLHHSVKRALRHIEPVFEEIILHDQNLFATPKGLNQLIYMISDETARADLEAYLTKTHKVGTHSKEIWESVQRYIHSQRTGNSSSIWARRFKYMIDEFMLGMVYPRLDVNVSKGINHLLKAPFCIHPGTGKFCTPFSANSAANFDPTLVPNIAKLLQEINAFDDKSKAQQEDDIKSSRIKDYKKTSMFKGIFVFEEFVRKLEASLKQRARAIDISDAKMEF